MGDYKYSLIISQYYHSRHFFIVEFPKDNFIEKCKSFIEEVEDYKRGYKSDRYEYGDIGYRDSEKICFRYNVNDSGDIYFINANNLVTLLDYVKKYYLDSYKESRRYIKKTILEEVSIYHNYNKIASIVSRHFNIL